MIDNKDLKFLKRCLELAEEALELGNEPFGSILVSADGKVVLEEQNEVVTKEDPTHHPEFKIARWATQHLSTKERAGATVYTSGEHCPMCAAAHGLAGLGRIVYASSSSQLTDWLSDFKNSQSPVYPLPIQQVVKTIEVDGPAPGLAEKVRALHRRFYQC